MNIENAVVLVTGANRGIGKQLVETLIAHGAAKIYAGARSTSDMPDFGSSAVIPVVLDVTNKQQISDVAAQANDVTLLINNAGVLDFGDVLSVDQAQLTRAFDVNLFGLLNMSQAFAPILTENKGSMVNMLTLLSMVAAPGMSAYSASKAAAWSIHMSLKVTLAAQGVPVQGVFPGAVDTDMLSSVDMEKTSAIEVAQAIVSGVQANAENIFPDPMSQQVYSLWKTDHKAVEQQFGQM